MGLFRRGPHTPPEPAPPRSSQGADDIRVVRRDAGVGPALPLEAVARRMLESQVDAVVVFDASGAIGRVTSRELIRALAMGVDPRITKAEDVMVEVTVDVDGAGDAFWTRQG